MKNIEMMKNGNLYKSRVCILIMNNETKLNEIKNEVKEARELLEKAEFKLENYKDESKMSRLPIPEGIFLGVFGNIMFNNNRQELAIISGRFNVDNPWSSFIFSNNLELEPIDYKDIECGNTIVGFNNEENINNLLFWHKIDSENNAWYITKDNEVRKEKSFEYYTNFYKVVDKG